MDISQHKKTWAVFVRITTWSLVSIGVLMAFLLAFRTHG
ncbi:MAG TPA: aa3-type cytochrome c oxidase subunit IV [Rhizomicrobium sp.]|nr:aa3-type cytochrome c oxidase subunit IV [Rhizomicrobium sp.]